MIPLPKPEGKSVKVENGKNLRTELSYCTENKATSLSYKYAASHDTGLGRLIVKSTRALDRNTHQLQLPVASVRN